MKTNIIIVLLFFLSIKSNSQVNTPPSPNVASIGIFGQYPQSSFTGVPAINIPIYDFNYRGLSLPIELRYNSNLVKPNSYGSWVGMGWNLTAGGVISRVVNDKPDDADYTLPILEHYTQERNVGFYYNYNFLSAGDWATYSRLKNAVEDLYDYQYNYVEYPYLKILKDYAPDEFSFSVGDLSGLFYLNDQKQWVVKSKNDVKVEINSSSDFSEAAVPPNPNPNSNITYPNCKYLSRITLIDTRGIKYIFGGVPSALEMSRGATWSNTVTVKSWHLTRILFPSGREINYDYDTGQRADMTYQWWVLVSSYSIGTSVIRTTPAYLRSIETDNQKISFYRSENVNEFAKLDSIRVFSKISGEQIKKMVFTYKNTPMDRLKLTGFFDKDRSNQIFNRYLFDYNIAEFTSENTDHWGYYNLKPGGQGSYTAFFNSRGADTANCRAELLNSVVYPTGGYTRYIWEPHSYSKEVPVIRYNSLIPYTDNKATGGVRIKKIANYDSNGAILGSKSYAYIKNYDYIRKYAPNTTGSLSSGILYGSPKYVYLPSVDGTHFQLSLLPARPLMESNVGSHISYSEVAEINEDGSYSITNFSNFDNGVNNEYMDEPALLNASYPNSISLFEQYTSNSHERGFPLRIRDFSINSTLVSEKAIEYERINKQGSFIRSYFFLLFDDCTRFNDGYVWQGSAFKIYTNSYLPKKETSIIYDVNGLNPITSTSDYVYGVKKQIRQVRTLMSIGDSLITEYKYPYDFMGSSVYSQMVMQNRISPVILKEEFSLRGTSKIPVRSERTNYSFYSDINNQIYPSSLEKKTGTASFETRTNFTAYDASGNLLSSSIEGGANSTYLWGYNASLPIAKIENSPLITGTSSESTSYGNHNFINQMSYGTQYAMSGSTTIPQAFEATISRTYYKGDDHEAWFYTYIYNSSNHLIASFTDKMEASSTVLTVTGLTTLPAGTYTMKVSSNYQLSQSNLSFLQRIEVNMSLTIKNAWKAPYHTSFEDHHIQISTAYAKTGKQCHTGNLSVRIPPASSGHPQFILSYWGKVNAASPWTYVEQLVSAGADYTDLIIGNGYSYIDEVRLYPKNAVMTTYTYQPEIGMTSQMDAKGQTRYYEYDSFQRLKTIKDQNGEIIKSLNYNHKVQ